MRTIVLGGPGCGKTTELLRIIDDLLSKGMDPSRIAFLTFTKKAAREARDRSCTKFGFELSEIPFFRTIHSLAFKQLGITPDAVITDKLHEQFGKWAGYQLTANTDENKGISSATYDDRVMTTVSLARLMRKPLRDVCEETCVAYRVAHAMRSDFDEFKEARGVIDFTDMLERYLDGGVLPQLDALIVDEAQDLSALQWAIVERLAGSVEYVYFAGDDDQAIYGWAGADVDYFLSLEGTRNVLPKSYRLKSCVLDVAQSLVADIEQRYAKDWVPHCTGGEVSTVTDIHEIDLDKGTWFLLARNAYLLAGWKAHLYAMGYPFIDGDRATIDNDEVRAILGWEALRRGHALTGDKCSLVLDYVRKKFFDRDKECGIFDAVKLYTLKDLARDFQLTADDVWFDVLDLAPHRRKYYAEIKHKGFSLVKTPAITVSTIHGVKGGEADNVLLATDMSRKTHAHLSRCPADELRVFFVATSRAKNKLFIQEPKTPESINIRTRA